MSRKYECLECGDLFDSQRGLHIHIGKKHPEKKEKLLQEEKRENLLKRQILKKPLRLVIALVLIFLAIFSLYLSESVDKEEMEERSELSTSLISLIEVTPEFEEADFEIIEESSVSGLKRVEAEITTVDHTEQMTFYGSKDGEKLFFDPIYTERDEKAYESDEAGKIAVDVFEEMLNEQGDLEVFAEFKGSDGELNGVYHVLIELSAEGYPSETVDSYITKDGQIFFPEGLDIEALIEDYKNIATEEPPETVDEQEDIALGDEEMEEFSKCVAKEATLYGAEWCGFTQQQFDVFGDYFENIDYVECTEEEELCQEEGIESYPTWKINGEIHRGMKEIQEISQLTGCEYESKEDETVSEPETDKEMDEQISCLKDEGVVIYGAEWCPYCTELAESFGGYDVVDPIWVECTEEQQRCEEEMIDSGVPEIQIEGEKYEGQRNPEAIGEAAGC